MEMKKIPYEIKNGFENYCIEQFENAMLRVFDSDEKGSMSALSLLLNFNQSVNSYKELKALANSRNSSDSVRELLETQSFKYTDYYYTKLQNNDLLTFDTETFLRYSDHCELLIKEKFSDIIYNVFVSILNKKFAKKTLDKKADIKLSKKLNVLVIPLLNINLSDSLKSIVDYKKTFSKEIIECDLLKD